MPALSTFYSAYLWQCWECADNRTDVILAGYQAHGTLGRALQQGEMSVEIDQARISVNAQIHTMSGYSAHAGQNDLMRFIEGITPPPKSIHLIHGEPKTQKAFAEMLKQNGYTVSEEW